MYKSVPIAVVTYAVPCLGFPSLLPGFSSSSPYFHSTTSMSKAAMPQYFLDQPVVIQCRLLLPSAFYGIHFLSPIHLFTAFEKDPLH